MTLTDDERKRLHKVCANGTASQKRAAETLLGIRPNRNPSYRYKIFEKFREGGVEAFEKERRGRPVDDQLHGEVELAIKEVQDNVERPQRSDFKERIEWRLKKTISQSSLTRYLKKWR